MIGENRKREVSDLKKERETAFIKHLYQLNKWVKTDELAAYFSVSTRTIRHYISEINALPYPEPLIMSSNNKYKINEAMFQKYREQEMQENDIPETPIERTHYLLKNLIYNQEGLNIFDASEELCVSVASIEGDLKKVRAFIKKYDLHLQRKMDEIQLIGTEINKRKLMSQIFQDESNEEFLHLADIQSDFYGYDLSLMKEKVIDILNHYHLFINGYTINNILLHLVIAIERIKSNYVLEHINLKQIKDRYEYDAALDIAAEIEKITGVTFDTTELYYLTLLLASKTTTLKYNDITTENINDFIEPEYTKLANKIIHKVNEYFFIDISDDEFMIKFTLHLRNLITRATFNRYSKNPMTKKIKSSYPLIYDLSVFIANEIQEEENITIIEDEIAYIAFHIGAFFERKKELKNKVLCALICPEYYGMQMETVNRLTQTFSDSLEITRVLSTADTNIAQLNVDLVISTVEVPPIADIELIQINPFLTEADQSKIIAKISEMKKRRYFNNMKSYLGQYFEPSLFKKNIYFEDEIKMIRFLGEELVELDRIDQNYVESIIEREKISSTAFNHIVAVPHSMKMNGKRTSISIVINDKPVKWGESTVQIIAMIVMNREERKEFRSIFDSFIEVLSESKNANKMIESKNYEDFIRILSELMKHHN